MWFLLDVYYGIKSFNRVADKMGVFIVLRLKFILCYPVKWVMEIRQIRCGMRLNEVWLNTI